MEYYYDRAYASRYRVATGYHGTNEDDIQDDQNGQVDMLSLLSTVLHPRFDDKSENWTALVFLSVHLGPWNLLFQPYPPYGGTSFSVTLLSLDYIVRQTGVTLDRMHRVPKLVALKTPKLTKQPKSAHNSRLFGSIIKEYQILQSEALRNHDNIIRIYGCCWQTLDAAGCEPIPSLILEGARHGDLAHFSRTRDLTLRERLRLCIHITSALEAIHAVGVIHGDLKPENVLVFHWPNRGYTAKIADFGSAILLSETAIPTEKPNGTIFYSGPECDEEGRKFDRDELFKIDIFTLGITLASLIFGMSILDEMKKLPPLDLLALKRSCVFPRWLAATSFKSSADKFAYDVTEDDLEDENWITDLNWRDNSVGADESLGTVCNLLLKESLASSLQQRCGSAEEILWILKYMLRLHLRTLLKHQEVFPEQALSPERLASISRPMGMSQARLRKLTGMRVSMPKKLNIEEIMAISDSCLDLGCFFREARFVLDHSTPTQRMETKPRLHKSWRIRPFSTRRKSRTSSRQETVVLIAKKMLRIADAS